MNSLGVHTPPRVLSLLVIFQHSTMSERTMLTLYDNSRLVQCLPYMITVDWSFGATTDSDFG